MKIFYLSLVAVLLLAIVTFGYIAHTFENVVSQYQSNARTPIFSAFITLGSFLLTLKTTVLQRLKEGFDSKKHKEAYVMGGCCGKYYGSLHNMSQAIAICVFSSFLTSALQMTLGFIDASWSFAICAGMAIFTLGLVLFLWIHIVGAHQLWLENIEESKQKELKPENKSTQATSESID